MSDMEAPLITRREALRTILGISGGVLLGSAVLLEAGCTTGHSTAPQPDSLTVPEGPPDSSGSIASTTTTTLPEQVSGRRLVFASDRTGWANIWMSNLATGELTNLTPNNATYYNPKPSLDNKNVVLATDAYGPRTHIAALDLATRALTRLTQDNQRDLHYYWDPAYMPDGRIVYKQASENDSYGDICIMNPDGSEPQQITHVSQRGIEAWAPAPIDDTFVAFGLKTSPDRNHPGQIAILNTKTGDVNQITSGTDCWYPTVNHTSGRIGYISDNALYSMDQVGKAIRQVSPNDDARYRFNDPAWVPGGDSMVCSVQYNGRLFDVWLLDGQGSHQVLDESPQGHDGDLAPIIF